MQYFTCSDGGWFFNTEWNGMRVQADEQGSWLPIQIERPEIFSLSGRVCLSSAFLGRPGTDQAKYQVIITELEGLFEVKNRIIGELGFPQFQYLFGWLDGAARCHRPHGFLNSFDKRTAPHGNTFCPPVYPFGVNVFQGGLNPFQVSWSGRFIILWLMWSLPIVLIDPIIRDFFDLAQAL